MTSTRPIAAMNSAIFANQPPVVAKVYFAGGVLAGGAPPSRDLPDGSTK
jgi:hypothetical protein